MLFSSKQKKGEKFYIASSFITKLEAKNDYYSERITTFLEEFW